MRHVVPPVFEHERKPPFSEVAVDGWKQDALPVGEIEARGESRTHDDGFAIRSLSHLATRAHIVEYWNGRRELNSRIEFIWKWRGK